MDDIQKIVQDITTHFDAEVALRKEIIENEKILENLKFKHTEKEFENYKNNNKDKEEMNNLKKEIEKMEIVLNEKYTEQFLLQ